MYAEIAASQTDRSLESCQRPPRCDDGTPTASSPRPRTARSEDLPRLLRLIRPLEKNGVLAPRQPRQLQRRIEDFSIIERNRDIVCCAALHIHWRHRLGEIACVATCEQHRGRGYGALLLNHLERQARQAGLEQVFLRTAHAGDWFARRGFSEPDPALIPPAAAAATPGRNSRILCKPLP